MRVFFLAVSAILLTGGMAAAQTDASAVFQAQSDACGAQVKSGAITTAVALWTCRNTAMRDYLIRTSFLWMDLQDVNEADHIANARNYDLRRITPEEWIAIDTKIDSDFTTSLNQRVAAELQTRAAQQSQQLNALRQLGAQRQTQIPTMPQMPFQPPPITTTNCMPVGPGFSCTTQ